jgi:YggT family protein
VTLIYVIISWVNRSLRSPGALDAAAAMLAPIQRIIPAIGGIDLSPMVLLIIIYLLQMVISRLAL